MSTTTRREAAYAETPLEEVTQQLYRSQCGVLSQSVSPSLWPLTMTAIKKLYLLWSSLPLCIIPRTVEQKSSLRLLKLWAILESSHVVEMRNVDINSFVL